MVSRNASSWRACRTVVSSAAGALLLLACTGQLVGNSNESPDVDVKTEPVSCVDGPTPPAPRIWRLTHTQLKNSLEAVFGFSGTTVGSLPDDSRLEGFSNASDGLGISSLLGDNYFRVAEEVSADVFTRRDEFINCPLEELGGQCLDDFLTTYGLKAWRRPLSDAENGKLAALFSSVLTQADAELAFNTVVQALILSPNFLFRTELGTATVTEGKLTLTDFEVASSLSYTLWDAPPDDELLEQAQAGKLRDADAIAAQAKRLMAAEPRLSATLHAFFEQWLQTDKLVRTQKDPSLFPDFTPDVALDLLEENRRYVDSVLFDTSGKNTLWDLLTSSHVFVNQRTAPIYGLDVTGTTFTRMTLDPSERRGFFTQAAFLAAHANADSTAVVERGRVVREMLLCSPVPDPPADFVFDDAEITDDMTAREKFEIHRANPSCANCHELFDGIGVAMENYDAIGQYRTTDLGKQLDPSGVLRMPDDSMLNFETFVDLIVQMATIPEVNECFSSQYLMYATGLRSAQLDPCEKERVATAFAASGHTLPGLVLAIVDSPIFTTRKVQ